MPRAFCIQHLIQHLPIGNLRVASLHFGGFCARVFCMGILLLLLTGWFQPPFALADGSMPPENTEERSSAASAPPSPETPPSANRKAGNGKARNPYDMETLKRFDAGSHRQS
jgi:hypothetical protein